LIDGDTARVLRKDLDDPLGHRGLAALPWRYLGANGAIRATI
jgi:hypothetical protein